MAVLSNIQSTLAIKPLHSFTNLHFVIICPSSKPGRDPWPAGVLTELWVGGEPAAVGDEEALHAPWRHLHQQRQSSGTPLQLHFCKHRQQETSKKKKVLSTINHSVFQWIQNYVIIFDRFTEFRNQCIRFQS